MTPRAKLLIPLLVCLMAGIGIGITLTYNNNAGTDATATSMPEAFVQPASLPPIQNSGIVDFSNTFADVAERAVPAVVTIRPTKSVTTRDIPGHELFDRFFGPRGQQESQEPRRVESLGSGIIISPEGLILTNNHVVADADELEITTYDNQTFSAEIIGTDPKTDVAVIKVDAEALPYLPLGDSDALRIGEWVLAIGSPLSVTLSHSVTAGIVSAKGRRSGLAAYEDFIQTDAAINPGNSGGALVNLKGELIGINTAIMSRSGGNDGIGFAIPIKMASKVMEQLVAHGEVVRGYLGVAIADLNDNVVEGLELPDKDGVLVQSVVDDGPAEDAGLEASDVILSVDGTKTPESKILQEIVADIEPGKKVDIEIIRDGKQRTLTAKIGKQAKDRIEAAVEQGEAGTLGLAVEDISPEIRSRMQLRDTIDGVLVNRVQTGSVAQRNRIQRGDIIRRINRTSIESLKDYLEVVGNLDPGDAVVMHVYREGQSYFIDMKVPKGEG
jgi:serine protease Do